MNPLRKKIAQRLVTATQETALLTTFNEVDMLELMTLRKKSRINLLKSIMLNLDLCLFSLKQ